MYKKTVTFEELFSERETTATFYFHVSKTKLMRNMDIKDDLEAFENRIAGDDRELTTREKQDMLALVERLVKLSYGVRTEEDKHIQTEEVWNDFVDTPAYDAILFSVFEDNKSAVEFMTGILPRDIRAEAQAQLGKETQEAIGAAIPPNRPKVPLDRLQKGGELAPNES